MAWASGGLGTKSRTLGSVSGAPSLHATPPQTALESEFVVPRFCLRRAFRTEENKKGAIAQKLIKKNNKMIGTQKKIKLHNHDRNIGKQNRIKECPPL